MRFLIETWGKGIDRLFGLRDFIVTSGTGDKLVSATSAWLIIDRKTSRVQRIETLGKNFPMQLEKNELDVKLEKIEPQPSKKTGFEYVVRYSDVDVNGHVNSAKYVQWMLDSFQDEFHGLKWLKSFEINYLAEANLGDGIVVTTGSAGDYYYCSVESERDNTELCRAKVVWNEEKGKY